MLFENCQVEWDEGRGVLYVHHKDTGRTIVRISNLPATRETVKLDSDVFGSLIDVRASEQTSIPLA